MDVAAQHGYQGATIARVIAHAGVSRASFYAQFSGREECFCQALEQLQAKMIAQVGSAIEAQTPRRAATAAVGALLALADREPASARVLMNEGLAGGARVLQTRDDGLLAAAALIEDAYRTLGAKTRTPDMPSALLLGATQRLLASRLRRGEQDLLSLEDELLNWIAAYNRPLGLHRWRTLNLDCKPARSPFVPEVPLRAPPALSSGRPKRSARAISENQRLRIMFATASVVQARGYMSASVAEITRVAGVDARVFYRLFKDKQEAFTAIRELGFQRTMAVTAGAFFAAEEWPQRIWEAARALTQALGQNPSLSHASMIDGHVGAPETVERFEELVAGFTIFLQEGYQFVGTQDGRGPSALALEAVAAINFEALYSQARSNSPAMAGLLAHLSYICLVPFVGCTRAEKLIDELKDHERLARHVTHEQGKNIRSATSST